MLKIEKNIKNILILVMIFIFVLILTKIPATDALDKSISGMFYNFLNNEFITNFFLFITNYTIGTVVGAFLIVLLIHFRKNVQTALFFIVSLITTSLIMEIIKAAIQRTRPFISNIELPYLGIQPPTEFSFPSGHTTFAFFILIFITQNIRLNKWERALAYLLAFLVAFSRVYLGAHYVLDVVAGALLGSICALISTEIYKRINTAKIQ